MLSLKSRNLFFIGLVVISSVLFFQPALANYQSEGYPSGLTCELSFPDQVNAGEDFAVNLVATAPGTSYPIYFDFHTFGFIQEYRIEIWDHYEGIDQAGNGYSYGNPLPGSNYSMSYASPGTYAIVLNADYFESGEDNFLPDDDVIDSCNLNGFIEVLGQNSVELDFHVHANCSGEDISGATINLNDGQNQTTDGSGNTTFTVNSNTDYSWSVPAYNEYNLGVSSDPSSPTNSGGGKTIDVQMNRVCGGGEVMICSDGVDNDGDGLTDFPADPGCSDADDGNETDMGAGGGGSCMTPNSAVRGCSAYSEWPSVYKASANSCLSYCEANGANACEWNSATGDCFVEFGSGCYIQMGFPGWNGSVIGQCYTPPAPTGWIRCNGLDDSCNISSGSSAAISWQSNNTDSCTVSAPGWTGTSGSQSTGALTTNTTYSLSCQGTDGSTYTDSVVATILNAPVVFNYSIQNSGTSNVAKTSENAFTQNTITKTLTSGASEAVSLTLSGVPSGVSYSISNSACSPTCTSVITFTVTPSAPAGSYQITVTGSPLNKQTSFILNISGNPSSVTCSASPLIALIGEFVTWTASVSGGTPPFTYEWSGTNIPSSPAPDTNTFNISYSTLGQKSASVRVTDADYPDSPLATCPAGVVQINFSPTFEEF